MVLAGAIGCASAAVHERSGCLVATAATAEPQWLRIGNGAADSAGGAEAGVYHAAVMDGHWRRISDDSIAINVADVFGGMELRLRLRGQGASGEATIRSDDGKGSVRPWRGTWGACPSVTRPAT